MQKQKIRMKNVDVLNINSAINQIMSQDMEVESVENSLAIALDRAEIEHVVGVISDELKKSNDDKRNFEILESEIELELFKIVPEFKNPKLLRLLLPILQLDD